MKVRASIFSGNGGGLGGTLGGIFGGLATAATGIPQNISIIAQYGVAQRYPHLPPEVLAAAQGIANAAAIGLGLTVLLAGQVFFAWLFSFIGDLHARNGKDEAEDAEDRELLDAIRSGKLVLKEVNDWKSPVRPPGGVADGSRRAETSSSGTENG